MITEVGRYAPERRRAVVFGAGAGGRRVAAHLAKAWVIDGFVDNDARKHGSTIDGLPVRAPSTILEGPRTSVLVASVYSDAIYAQLLTLGVPPSRIEVIDPEGVGGIRPDPFPYGCAAMTVAAATGLTVLAWWILA